MYGFVVISMNLVFPKLMWPSMIFTSNNRKSRHKDFIHENHYDLLIFCYNFNFRETSKMQKMLRTKCKEMVPQNTGKKIYEGVVDDPDMNFWPAPLKIAHQTVKSIKEFRVRKMR